MSKITIDLVKLIQQAAPQVIGADDSRLLQWLAGNSGTEQMVTVDMMMPIKDKPQKSSSNLSELQIRINDVIIFSDASELRIHVFAPPGSNDDLSSAAYYGLLAAISDIQEKKSGTEFKTQEG